MADSVDTLLAGIVERYAIQPSDVVANALAANIALLLSEGKAPSAEGAVRLLHCRSPHRCR